MTVLLYCLLFAIIHPILAKAPVAFAMNKLGGYDNCHPREQQTKLTGFGSRALAAHQNSFEAVIMFAPCLLAAIATDTINNTVIYSAIAFVIARIAYIALYLMDMDKLRSLVWSVGLLSGVVILFEVLQHIPG